MTKRQRERESGKEGWKEESSIVDVRERVRVCLWGEVRESVDVGNPLQRVNNTQVRFINISLAGALQAFLSCNCNTQVDLQHVENIQTGMSLQIAQSRIELLGVCVCVCVCVRACVYVMSCVLFYTISFNAEILLDY